MPEHNRVSSEWEKKEVIRKAYDGARAAILPRLIHLLEEHVGDTVWVASTDLFRTPSDAELWTKPDYLAVHNATSASSNKDSDNNTAGCQEATTTTQFFLARQQQEPRVGGSASTAKAKLWKGLPDKCLLRHEFSPGCHWFRVCKLRRRHQKEIAKHPSLSLATSRSSPHPPSSSAVLDELASSAVRKYHNQSSKNAKNTEVSTKDETGDGTQINADVLEGVDGVSNLDDWHQQQARQETILLEKANDIITEAMSIVRAAKNLEVGVVPKTSVVRWKAEDEFEIHYFK